MTKGHLRGNLRTGRRDWHSACSLRCNMPRRRVRHNVPALSTFGGSFHDMARGEMTRVVNEVARRGGPSRRAALGMVVGASLVILLGIGLLCGVLLALGVAAGVAVAVGASLLVAAVVCVVAARRFAAKLLVDSPARP
jgi:hypothetical protein